MSKQEAIGLLKEKYLSHMKRSPEVFVGIELEFPIVEVHGKKTDINVTKKLFRELALDVEFEVEKRDQENNPVQLIHRASKDRILFELSYNTIEFAFEKAKSIHQVDQRFKNYLKKYNQFFNNTTMKSKDMEFIHNGSKMIIDQYKLNAIKC